MRWWWWVTGGTSIGDMLYRLPWQWWRGDVVLVVDDVMLACLHALAICKRAHLLPPCHPAGVLLLNECGSSGEGGARTVRPHPNFRLFLALDPRWGC
jgi:midasin